VASAELLLSEAELVALTEAKTRPTQSAWLNARGFTYEVGAKGGIKVLRAHVTSKMGGAPQASTGKGPNVDFFPPARAVN
jgi:hypothetical protein